jgi:prepilin-type N-terminal cleavage/methylation domain-containing protein
LTGAIPEGAAAGDRTRISAREGAGRKFSGGRGQATLRRACGISLTELLVVVAVLGVLAAVAIPLLVGLIPVSQENVALDAVERLNRAVHSYEMAVREISLAAGDGANVVALLRTRSAQAPGSPYLDDQPSYAVTSSAESYRARWSGRVFELLVPGQDGTGLDLQVR